MRVYPVKVLLLGLVLLLSHNRILAAITPPPFSWQPEYTAKILVFKDQTADVGHDFTEYAKARVSYLNSVLKRSRANIKVHLIGAIPITMRTFKNAEDFMSDGYVREMKQKLGADIAFLFAELDFGISQCGFGVVTNSNKDAFSIGRAGYWLCLSGDTFVHEVGHNLGLTHTYSDRKDDLYASGYGTFFWVTMMSYSLQHGGLITKHVFSNPALSCDKFYQCGDETLADAVRFINDNAVRFTRNY